MQERRLPTSTPAAAGPRRHSRRPRRRCRLLLLSACALALLSLACLSFSSHSSLPFHVVHHGLVNRESDRNGMDQRYTLNAMVKLNISMTKDESEPFKRQKKSRKRYVPCEIEFLPSVDKLVEPADYNNFTQFSLNYILKEEELSANGFYGQLFVGTRVFRKGRRHTMQKTKLSTVVL